jgi:hypothetical protein
MPRADTYAQLYSFTKEEKKIKGGISGSRKLVLIKDFRENERYDEDIAALKEEVEEYISRHPDLAEATKNNLRELRITAGAAQKEISLLLGKPDRVIESGDKAGAASEIWIYRINKSSIFTVIVIPVFFTQEAYYLYFKDTVLTKIERHYLEQTFETSGIGLNVQKK